MTTPAAVLFDLDGTLIDTTSLILASCAHTFERHLGFCPPREALIATFGRSLPEALRELAVTAGAADPDAEAAAMLATYRAHNDEHHDVLIQPFDGIEAMLATLHATGLRLGVVTSKREAAARRGLRHYRLDRFFDAAVFHDDTELHKPHPDPLLEAARRLGIASQDAVYVGDSVHDVAAGRSAGMETIAVLWGPFSRADLECAGPTHLAAHPRDVARLLGLAGA
ncbi:MAG TPA: HAD-IA family hydrolase [Gemmatimonadales bacterium]|nr:HAD-IA family hydrolase [Gemmatimonadales bacterium]